MMLPVIVYGNGDLFREYFNAIVAAFGKGGGHSHFNSLLHIAILLAGFTVVYTYTLRRDLMQIVKWLGMFYVAVYLLFIPEATVVITDRVNNDIRYTVDHVPRGLAVIASYTSAIGDGLTQDIESNFTMPDYQLYHQTGMVFASRMVEAVSQFEITDSQFDENLKEFIHQCVFYDILLKKYTINELTSSPHIWDFVASYASPARGFVYDGTVTTCREGALKLSAAWSQAIDSSAQAYGKRIYPSLAKEEAKKKLLLNLPVSYGYLTRLSEEGSEIMKQNLMGNAIQRGILSMGAKINAPAALESYAFTRAQEQKRLTNKTIGDMAAYWLPLMKNAFEAIMYGSFIFVVLLSVFPFGWMILKNYIYTLLWIQIWAPLYAIINLIVSFYAQSKSTAVVDGALSPSVLSGLLQVNSDISGLAGYLTLSVPFLSAGLVKGMASTFTHLSQYVGGVTQAAGGAAATEAVTGNFNLGNTSFNNHNAFNTSANHVDTSGRVSSGSFTSQLPGGSSLTITPDGSSILDMRNAMSHLGASVNLAKNIHSSYMQQAEKSQSAALSNAHSFGESTVAEIKDIYELGKFTNQSNVGSNSWSKSASAGTAEAINENINLTNDFASRHGLSHDDANNILINTYAEGKASAGIGGKFLGAGISGGISRTSGHNVSNADASLYAEAQNFIKNTHYSKNIDTVEKSIRDHSFRINNENGSRLIDNIGESLNKAESARREMQSNFAQSESAKRMASMAEDNGASINVNANQHFSTWLADQPGTNGAGHLGYWGAEAIKEDPEMMQYYANRYVAQYRSKIMSQWDHGLTHTSRGIENQFHVNNQAIRHPATIEEHHQRSRTSLAASSGLSSTIDQSIVNNVEQAISQKDNKISHDGNDLITHGEAEMRKAKEEMHRKHKD